MKKLFLYFISFFLFFNLAVNSEEITPIKKDFEETSISVEETEIRNQMEKALARAKDDFKK